MKYIKTYNLFLESSKTEIESFLNRNGIFSYELDDNGGITVDQDIKIYSCESDKLPIVINNMVNRSAITLSNLKIKSLDGLPHSVSEIFLNNLPNLKSIKDIPIVYSDISIDSCPIESLDGIDNRKISTLSINNTNIENLKGCPNELYYIFVKNCDNLISLDGIPSNVESWATFFENSNLSSLSGIENLSVTKTNGILIRRCKINTILNFLKIDTDEEDLYDINELINYEDYKISYYDKTSNTHIIRYKRLVSYMMENGLEDLIEDKTTMNVKHFSGFMVL